MKIKYLESGNGSFTAGDKTFTKKNNTQEIDTKLGNYLVKTYPKKFAIAKEDAKELGKDPEK